MPLMNDYSQNQKIDEVNKKLDDLTKKFDDYVNSTKAFRRKLEAEISKIRESHGDIADKLDELLIEWNEF